MAGMTSGPIPIGYQAPKAPGQVNPDEEKQIGAPTGYKWDPVKQQYQRTPSSVASDMTSMLGMLSGFGNSSSGGGNYSSGPSTPMPQIQSPGGGGLAAANAPNVAAVGPIDTSGAQSAAFGRAKDQVGDESAGALAGLRSALGGRGMLGSGAESRGTMGVVNQGQRQLGEVSRQQAIEKSGLAERQAESNRGAAVTQRGQTIGENQSNASRAASIAQAGFEGQIQQRGQNISQQIAQNNLAAENARAQAAQRQSMLTGLMAALNSSRSTY